VALQPPFMRPSSGAFLSHTHSHMHSVYESEISPFPFRLPVCLSLTCREKGAAKLQVFDKVFRKIVTTSGLDPSSLDGKAFLNTVLLHEMDENRDGRVNREELLTVQVKAERYAEIKNKEKCALPDWLSLLDSIFMGFDRESLVPLVATDVMQSLDDTMKASDCPRPCC